MDDSSYSIVVAGIPGDNADNAEIYSVGEICSDVVYSHLVGVFDQHMPVDAEGRRHRVDIGDLAWRKQAPTKPLYQLQIEVGEEALRELSEMVDRFPDKKSHVERSRENIEAELKKLRRTDKPFFLKKVSLPAVPYPKEAAERVREAVNKGLSGPIVIIK
jgi:hypothetical protein